VSRLRGQLCSTASLAESGKNKETTSYNQSCIKQLKKYTHAGEVSVFCERVEVCKDVRKGL
jgi:hypothetical protein